MCLQRIEFPADTSAAAWIAWFKGNHKVDGEIEKYITKEVRF